MTIHQKINFKSYSCPNGNRITLCYHFYVCESPLVVEPELCEIPFHISKGSQKYTLKERYFFTR